MPDIPANPPTVKAWRVVGYNSAGKPIIKIQQVYSDKTAAGHAAMWSSQKWPGLRFEVEEAA